MTILLSVRSPHVERLLAGTKTVELRRRPLNVAAGTTVLLYASGERREIVGSFVAGTVESGSPTALWTRFGKASGLTRREFTGYLAGVDVGYVLPATDVRVLRDPIPLEVLRGRWPAFTTPQTYRRVHHGELAHILNGERSQLIDDQRLDIAG